MCGFTGSRAPRKRVSPWILPGIPRAIWSHDGKEIAFWSNRGEGGVFTISADGQTKPIMIDGKPVRGGPEAWSHDGKYLLSTSSGTCGELCERAATHLWPFVSNG